MLRMFLLFFLFSFVSADVFKVMGVSSSGMIVQQQKLQAVAENIANMNSFQSSAGDAYKRKSVIIRTSHFNDEPYVSEVIKESGSVQKVYDPGHPMADQDGFINIPGYSLSQEMSEMAVARRMYEANAAMFSSAKQTAQTLMNIGR